MKDDLGLTISLSDLGIHHMDTHLDFTNFVQSREGVSTILELEEKRYYEMLRKGEAAVKTALRDLPKDSPLVPDEILFRLAEERGLNPDMVVSIAHSLGWPTLSVRVGFAADMAARNAERTKIAAKTKAKSSIFASDGLPTTMQDYYSDTSQTSFDASVLDCSPLSETQISDLNLSNEVSISPTHSVVLDRTLFYPEGGGQLGDQGILGNVEVADTRVEDGVIFHLTNGAIELGEIAGQVNWSRRRQLMDHHTAVHIVGGSARNLLGPHIWQAGSNKGERYARIDLTHYSRLSRDDLDKIEDYANEIIAANPMVEKMVLDRAEADKKFGFELYQGGPPKHSEIRVIKIGDYDVQACGGTHHDEA
ncbi:MAG TPA: alanine--tRNA ligase-related protein, partial [Candidatus Thalassarchaeaceae archaeon]|nr:alanine--tRNA ligase-related protein [Candidatus Thalassarchaeaceae archaeon]